MWRINMTKGDEEGEINESTPKNHHAHCCLLDFSG